MQISLNFKTFCSNVKIRDLGEKSYVTFQLLYSWKYNNTYNTSYIRSPCFNFERNYDVLKSKTPCFLLIKKLNCNKNEMEPKMENPIHAFRETIFEL